MSLDTTVPRSRRALLAAALGAGVATVAQALGRPAPVRANDPNDVLLGAANHGPDSTTAIFTTSASAFGAQSGSGNGVEAQSNGDGKSGVYGRSTHSNGYGVFGRGNSWDTTGFLGGADIGAHGVSPSWMGVMGATDNGWGVVGTSGLAAFVVGQEAKTGVYGVGANGSTSVGVRGDSAAGTAGWFASTSGTALRVDGKAKFSRSKRVNIGRGKSSLKVYLTGVTSSSLVFAVLHSNRSGLYVRAVIPSGGYFTIYLNKATTYSTNYVAYFVVN